MAEPEERRNKGPDVEITEIDFEAPCPVEQCKNKDDVIKWKHAKCGGKSILTDEGELRCAKCSTKGLFIDWRFDCGAHDYREASLQGIAHSLSIMSQLSVSLEQQNFIAKTTQKIMAQYINNAKS